VTGRTRKLTPDKEAALIREVAELGTPPEVVAPLYEVCTMTVWRTLRRAGYRHRLVWEYTGVERA